MRIAPLGHASLLIESGDTAIAMDPVFFDPYEHERMRAHPPRTVHLERFPPLRAIVLSHGHADHFDARSMAALDRRVPVYHPDDGDLGDALEALGFGQRVVVRAWQRCTVGEIDVWFTPSRDADELGAVFIAPDATAWNQVDTGTEQATAVQVLEGLGGGLDLVICPYSPLHEHGAVWLTDLEFPRERYERLLEAAVCSRARCVVPGSCGQSYMPPDTWRDRVVFPVAAERFLSDLAALAPEVQGLHARPGHAVHVDRQRPARLEPSPYATLGAPPWPDLGFDPSGAPGAVVTDTNPEHLERDVLERLVGETVQMLNRRLEERLTPLLVGPLRTLWDRRAQLQIDVVFPEERRSFHLARWVPRARFMPGPVSRPGGADYTFTYVASEMAAWLRGSLEVQRATLRIARRVGDAPGDAFRLSTLEPARLHGEDPYYVIDAEFAWHPLGLLLQ